MFNNNNNNNPNMQELLASFEQHIKTFNEKVSTFEDEMTNLNKKVNTFEDEMTNLNKEVKQLRITVQNGSFGPAPSKFHKKSQKNGRNDFGGKN
jgi:peptidoglycan hydrolase CwlO-like protein